MKSVPRTFIDKFEIDDDLTYAKMKMDGNIHIQRTRHRTRHREKNKSGDYAENNSKMQTMQMKKQRLKKQLVNDISQ